jgi:hypothetical protein
MLEIVEILRPSDQGRNKAFLCRGEDEQLYFVKGRNAGKRRQCTEWLVGHLAKSFGIPIPSFQLVNISDALISNTKPEYQDLGVGIAFASEAQNPVQWFERSFVEMVPSNLRLDVLVFDWWVQNDDRLQDNPNLLWDTQRGKLHVIDHDSAFSPDFFPTVFRNYHIFHENWGEVFGNLACQTEYSARMSNALSIWDDACHNAPPDWIDHTGTNSELFNLSTARTTLERCLTTEIWRME